MNNVPTDNNDTEDEQNNSRNKRQHSEKMGVLREENMAKRSVLPKIKAGKKLRKITEGEKETVKQITLQLEIKKDIEEKRKELFIITELEKGSRGNERKVRNIEKNTKFKENQSFTEIKEIIK